MLYPGQWVWLKSGGPDMMVMDYHPPTGTVFVMFLGPSWCITEFFDAMLTTKNPNAT